MLHKYGIIHMALFIIIPVFTQYIPDTKENKIFESLINDLELTLTQKASKTGNRFH